MSDMSDTLIMNIRYLYRYVECFVHFSHMHFGGVGEWDIFRKPIFSERDTTLGRKGCLNNQSAYTQLRFAKGIMSIEHRSSENEQFDV